VRSALALGARLAIGTGGQRWRSAMTVAASALSTIVLLLVWGIAHSQVGSSTAFEGSAVMFLEVGTIGMVSLPVLVLVSTVARLSASLRDRRLSNLRLLGMSAGQTRVVAASEVGLSSALGVAAGALLFWLVAASISRIDVAGQELTIRSLTPPWWAWVTVVIAVTVVSVSTAAIPQRLSTRRALLNSRNSDGRPPSLLRLMPLTVGFILCWWTRGPLDHSPTLTPGEMVTIVVGIALLALGVLLVIPVFVALVAEGVLRGGSGPLATLTGRRLQTQHSAATRVISALMMGLFIVVGARAVLTAFESTEQYRYAADFVEREQTAEVTAHADDATSTASTLHGIDGVRRVETLPVLFGGSEGSSSDDTEEVTVVVASCAALAGTDGRLEGCSDDRPSVVGDPWFAKAPEALQVRAVRGWAPEGSSTLVPLARTSTIDPEAFARAVGALSGTPVVIVPPGPAGVDRLAPATDRLLVAHAGPGRDLYDAVFAAGLRVDSMVDLENYDFVAGTHTVVWTLAVVILSVGLLTFTIAGVDRALARRRELTALRLVGTPASLLRRAQWFEAALPTMLGSVLAIFAGAYAGATYLQLDKDQVMPLTSAMTLAAAAVATSAVLASLTVIGTASRLDPEHIRAE
jgi:putative ABC transport system permease protein